MQQSAYQMTLDHDTGLLGPYANGNNREPIFNIKTVFPGTIGVPIIRYNGHDTILYL